MAVFYDTGGGDIYGGPTREAVIEAMRADIYPDDFNEKDVFEVPGTSMIHVSDENEQPTGKLVALQDEYTESMGAYCIASENC